MAPEVVDAAGKYSALNITVCNMSLGGPTLYAGRDLQDQLTQAFLDKDIDLRRRRTRDARRTVQ